EFAQTLEGAARHTGVHACAVIIARDDITNYVPVALAKSKGEKGETQVVTTQFDGPNCELAGLLKMDFLGLKTLTILKSAIRMVEENHATKVDLDNINLEDPATYTLYQKGE